MFPRKSYPLDDECDLIEIESVETAYCLCRHDDFCNEKSISDQFISFEEQHPELFDEFIENNPPETLLSNTQPERQLINADARRLEQTTVEVIEDGRRRQSAAPIVVDSVDRQRNGDSRAVFNTATSTVTPHSIGVALRCVQCGQSNLEDAGADCEKQIVVECNRRGLRPPKEEQYFCFTRQILIGPRQNAVEKMCVTQTALIQEYGSDVILDGCTSTNTDRVRFCVCQTNECNRVAINQKPVTSCILCSENNLNSAELDCSKPVAVDCDQQFKDGSGSLCLTRRAQLAPAIYSVEKRCMSRNELNQNAGQMAVGIGCGDAMMDSLSIAFVKVNFAIATPSQFNCKMTLNILSAENNLNSAELDCSKPVAVDCDQQFKDGSGSLCLTRRAQLAPAIYSVEKRCMSRNELNQNAGQVAVGIGCGDAYDGLVVYCICEGQLCNRDAIAVQLQNDAKYIKSTSDCPRTLSLLTWKSSRQPAVVHLSTNATVKTRMARTLGYAA
uniref:Uncharacterized protein n=1 Tax=Parascaris univalens TaxID=6257 RepID=A0A915B2V3_PARUN